jgi:hypothetical protein
MTAHDDKSLQETYGPEGICFGCGPANEKGLRIRSFAEGDDVVCEWSPQSHHQAFAGVLNGGIIGSLFDCHMNWSAATHLMRARGEDVPPCTVTADYAVQLKRPTTCTGTFVAVEESHPAFHRWGT